MDNPLYFGSVSGKSAMDNGILSRLKIIKTPFWAQKHPIFREEYINNGFGRNIP
jgi:hypothetical protein